MACSKLLKKISELPHNCLGIMVKHRFRDKEFQKVTIFTAPKCSSLSRFAVTPFCNHVFDFKPNYTHGLSEITTPNQNHYPRTCSVLFHFVALTSDENLTLLF